MSVGGNGLMVEAVSTYSAYLTCLLSCGGYLLFRYLSVSDT